MKQLILLLFISTSAIAQTDTNISVVSAEKLNIVYRGVPNPIKVAYPGSDSLVVTAPGLRKAEGKNNYILTPGAGNDVTVTIVAIMPDGSRRAERKVFRVKGLPAPMGGLDGENCSSCLVQITKEGLANTVVTVFMPNFLYLDFDSDYWRVISFTVQLEGKKIKVEGNKFSKETIEALGKLTPGTTFTIEDIKYKGSEEQQGHLRRVHPIEVILVKTSY